MNRREESLLVAALLLLTPTLGMAQSASPAEQLAAASALYDAKKYDAAAAKLDVFLIGNAKHPKAGAAALVLAQSRVELKQWDKAIAAYERAIETKDAAIVPNAQLGLGEAAVFAKQYDKAVPALTDALKNKWKSEQASRGWYLLGESQFQLGKFDKAEEAFGRVVMDYAKSDSAEDANFRWAQTALRQDKFEAARDRFRRFLSRFSGSTDKPQALLLLAQLELKNKRYGEARQAFEETLNEGAVKSNPAMTRAAEDGLIQTLLALKDDNAAAMRLDSAIAKLPVGDVQRFRASLALGHSRYRLKEFGKAVAAYGESAKSLEPKVAEEAAYWQANAVSADSKPADAAKLYLAFAEKYTKSPNAPKAGLRAAEAYAQAKQNEPATGAYRVVVAKFPQSPEAETARKALSGMTASISDPDKLIAAMKTAAPADKAKGLVRAARLYLTAEKTDKAIPVLDEVILSKPENNTLAEAYFLLGVGQDAKDKNQLAFDAFAKAVKLLPGAEWANTATGRLAWLSLSLKKPADAEKYAQDTLAKTSDKPQKEQLRLSLLQAQQDQKKWDDAISTAKAIINENPNAEVAATALYAQAISEEERMKPDDAAPLWERLSNDYGKTAYGAEASLRIGDALMKAEKWDEARDKYSQVIGSQGDSALAVEAKFKLGSVYYNQQKYTEAVAEFESVTASKKAGEYLPEGLYWAGVAQDKAGKKDSAIAHLTRLTTEFPKHTRVANAKIRLAALKAVK